MGFLVPPPPIPPPSTVVRDNMKFRFVMNSSRVVLYAYKKYWWPRLISWIINAETDMVNVTGCKECKYLKYNGNTFCCCHDKRNQMVIYHWELYGGDKIYYDCPLPKARAIISSEKL